MEADAGVAEAGGAVEQAEDVESVVEQEAEDEQLPQILIQWLIVRNRYRNRPNCKLIA